MNSAIPLRDRLIALADLGFTGCKTYGDLHDEVQNIAIAAARMALDEARDVAGMRSACEWADKHDVCAAVSSLADTLHV